MENGEHIFVPCIYRPRQTISAQKRKQRFILLPGVAVG